MTNHIIVTNYGPVKISKRVADYMDVVCPGWADASFMKKKSKKALAAKTVLQKLETAVQFAAELEWHQGGTLRTF